MFLFGRVLWSFWKDRVLCFFGKEVEGWKKSQLILLLHCHNIGKRIFALSLPLFHLSSIYTFFSKYEWNATVHLYSSHWRKENMNKDNDHSADEAIKTKLIVRNKWQCESNLIQKVKRRAYGKAVRFCHSHEKVINCLKTAQNYIVNTFVIHNSLKAILITWAKLVTERLC